MTEKEIITGSDEKISANITDHGFKGIKDMPEVERPREKLISKGPGSLSNAELLALLLGGGTRELSALSLAERLLSVDSTGILFLADCSSEELCRIRGIGPARSAVLMAAVELGRRICERPAPGRVSVSDPTAIADLFMHSMRYMKKECFKVLLLNIKNEIISVEEVSIGSLSGTEAHPREVFALPLKRAAASVVLVHNHPSGDPQPSRADIEITERLSMAGEILGIEVLDHVIIGDGRFLSLRQEGYIKKTA